MNDELLISLVRDYEELYDHNHADYHSQRRRDAIWKEISESVDGTVDECKRRWTSLRDLFLKATKTRQSKNGSVDSLKPWKYEKQMLFLLPFFSTKLRRVNDSTSKEDQNFRLLEDQNYQLVEVQNFGSEDHDASLATTSEDSSLHEVTPPSSSRLRKKRSRSTLRMMKEFLENDGRKRRSADHLTKYFEATEEVVRTFPPLVQIRVKSQISTLIHQTELDCVKYSEPPV